MNIKWTLIGCNWKHSIIADQYSNPLEVATLCLEDFLKKDEDINFGIILELKNSKMKSHSEHILMLTSTVLANAGLYSQASMLETKIDSITQKK